LASEISVDAVTAELRERVRARLRQRLTLHHASPAFEDPELFSDVERLLQTSITEGDGNALLLPDLLGDPDTWRVQTALHYQSHRSTGAGAIVVFFKRRVIMPFVRWLFEYSRDNFERQRRVNQVLFACIQELAIENAALRKQMRQESPESGVRPEALDAR